MNSPHTDSRHAPEPPGTADLHPLEDSPGSYRAEPQETLHGEITVVLECLAAGFPFERYCRYVRHKGGKHPYTFPSMDFSADPPGLRLGPWPGWRGIPELPVLTVSCGRERMPVQVMFWGDEISRKILRGFCRITPESGRELVVTSADPEIVPVRVLLYRTTTVRSHPLPVALRPELSGAHPRLLITPSSLPALRARAAGSHASGWQTILDLLDSWDLPFAKTGESKAVGGPQRFTGEDRVVVSALIAFVDPREENVRRTREAFLGFVEVTGHPDFEPLTIDTQAGEVLFVLCLGYDWLYSMLTPAERQRARERLEQIAIMCRTYLGDERRDYGQAHYLGCGLGLLAFSFLFWEDHPGAPELAARLRGDLDCALSLLPEDGSYPHGINLWIYEFGFLLRWLELLRVCTGEDLWRTTAGVERASRFRAATLSPDALYGVTIGDPQYRVGGDSWCHYLIAARTGSSLAQSLGTQLQFLPHEGVDVRNVPARRRVYEFLFFDPSVAPAGSRPQVEHFADGGQICLRSSDTVFTFRSGPPLGAQRYCAGEYGAYGHSDPANGTFLLYRQNTFLVNGSGPVYRRDSSLHNVVTIDGQGQIGDSTVWLPDFFPPDVLAPPPAVRIEGTRIAISVELSGVFLPHLEVEQCTRALYVDLDRFIVGVDTVRCTHTHSLELNMHSWGEFVPVAGERGGVFSLPGGVRYVLLAPSGATGKTGLTEFVPAYPNDGTRDYFVKSAVRASEMRFIWCYLFKSERLPAVEPAGESTFHVSFAGGLSLLFDGRWLIPDPLHAHHS